MKMNNERREELIFGAPLNKAYDIERFEGLSLEQLKTLVTEGFAKTRERQNYSPSIGEFLDYFEDGGVSVTFHGYVVSPERADTRVSVEGFVCRYADHIVNDFHHADEFTVYNGWIYAWWD